MLFREWLIDLSAALHFLRQILYLVSNETSSKLSSDKRSRVSRFDAILMQTFKYLDKLYFSASMRFSIKFELETCSFSLVVFAKYSSASCLVSSARYSSIRGKTSWTHSSKTQNELI